MGYTSKVREFTLACSDEITSSPKKMSAEAVQFIRKMIDDELRELENSSTIAQQADALVDVIYYICDTAVRHGMNLDPLFEIVHSANMGKVVDGKVIRRDDGKILKPAGWVDPQKSLDEEVQRQFDEGSF